MGWILEELDVLVDDQELAVPEAIFAPHASSEDDEVKRHLELKSA